MNLNKNKIFNDKNIKLYFTSIIIGILTGLIVSFYRFSLGYVTILRLKTFSRIVSGNFIIIFITLISFFIIALFLNKLIIKYPMIKGSGISQIKCVLFQDLESNWFKELIYKFIGGVLSVGSGLSLGRGGPSIQLGSQIAYGIRQKFKIKNENEKFLISSGISAGLAAAFNAPLAGIIFVVEEIHKYITPVLLICISLSSISADIIVQMIFGKETLFHFKKLFLYHISTTQNLISILIFAILVSFLGIVFTKGVIYFKSFYQKLPISPLIKSLIIFLISILIGIYILDVQGVGYNLIIKTNSGLFTMKFLLILFIGKFLFTIISNGPGFPGGLFLPSLVLGALLGKLYGLELDKIFNLNSSISQYYMILGMASFFTVVMRTPLTATILLLEMTGSFSYLHTLIVVTVMSYIITEIVKVPSINNNLYNNIINETKN